MVLASPEVDVPTPELGGESITEGTIAEWTAKAATVLDPNGLGLRAEM